MCTNVSLSTKPPLDVRSMNSDMSFFFLLNMYSTNGLSLHISKKKRKNVSVVPFFNKF